MKLICKILIFFLMFCVSRLIAQRNTVDSLENLLKGTIPDTSKIIILNALSENFYRQGKYDSSVLYAHKALDLAGAFNSENENRLFIKKAIIKAYGNLGNVYREKAEYDRALNVYAYAVKTGEEIRRDYPGDSINLRTLAITYNSMGGTSYFKGNYDESLSAYFKALMLFEKIADNQKVASCFNNIGLIQEAKKNYDQANQYYFKAISMYEKGGNKRGMANCYNNIGSILSEKKEYDKALTNYFMAMNLNKETGNKNWLAFNYQNIGGIYEEKKEFEKALAFYLKTLAIRKEINELRGIAISYGSIGNIYFKQGNYNTAKESLLIALKSIREMGTKPEMLQVCLSLEKCDSALGNYKSAFMYHKLYSQTKDSIFNEESNRQMAEMETKYETEKKENENMLLVKENEVKDLEIGKYKAQKYVLIASIILVVLISFLIYNRYRLKQEKLWTEEMLRQEKFRIGSMIMAQEQERKRIAEELHDGIGQMLSAVKLNVSALEENSRNDIQYKNAIELIDGSCNEVRNISHHMMPGLLMKAGLIPAVKDLADKLISSSFEIFVEDDGFENRLENNMEIHLFRIVQELLGNIIKYARASEVHIQFNKCETDITLMVEDNGAWFDKNILKTSSGNGWNNIYSRLEILNAKIEIDSQTGRGTVVFVEVPLG